MKIDTKRFAGFASLYSESRPSPPPEVCQIVLDYLGKKRSHFTVDLGCGTGLSTSLWTEFSDRVVGIDPTEDMLNEAMKRNPNMEFFKGDSYTTGITSSSVDIVTCSQSFHWMEPFAAIDEVTRILTHGGIFAVYDCMWPVSWDWESEKAYIELLEDVDRIVSELQELNTMDHCCPK